MYYSERKTFASVYGVTVSSIAQDLSDLGFTDAEIANAEELELTVETQPLNIRFDGTAAGAGAGGGHHVPVGGNRKIVPRDDVIRLSVIAEATDGAISVSLKK